MSKLYKLLFPIKDFLYILQLEEYDHRRYILQVSKRFFKRSFEKRSKLRFTGRIYLILFFYLLLSFFILSITLYFFGLITSIALIAVYVFSTPLTLGLVSCIIGPCIFLVRAQKLRRTHAWFKKTYPATKIIAITGSYGKTTTKYALQSLLTYSFKTAIVPENINTTLGISDYLLSSTIPRDTEYLIVEMGAYRRGDIKEAVSLLPPDISIITCLGDQHLERFGSFENLVTGKNEIFSCAPQGAVRFADQNTLATLRKHSKKTDNIEVVQSTTTNANLALATAVARHLHVSESLISDALQNFVSPERRDQTYELNGVTIIDNSYNISPQTARYIIEKAATAAITENKKLVVLTAGIAEQGNESNQVNQDLTTLINNYAARAILLPSCYMPSIKSKLTIPVTEIEFALAVLHNITDFVDRDSEVLLQLPEHTDLVYF